MTRDTNEWLYGTRSSWDSSKFQLVKNFPEFYANWKSIAVYTGLSCFLPCEPDEHISLHPFLYKIRFFSPSHLCLGLPCGLFPLYLTLSSLYAFLWSLQMQLPLRISSLLIWSLIEHSSSPPLPSGLRPTYCSPRHPVLVHPHRPSCKPTQFVLHIHSYVYFNLNHLSPNDPYRGRTAPLTSKRCILYIYSTNIGTEYFKHGI